VVASYEVCQLYYSIGCSLICQIFEAEGSNYLSKT